MADTAPAWAAVPLDALTLTDQDFPILAALYTIPPAPDGTRWATSTDLANITRTKRDRIPARLAALQTAGHITPNGRDGHRRGWQTRPAKAGTVHLTRSQIETAGKHLRVFAAVKSFRGEAGCFPSRAAIAARLGYPNPDQGTAVRKVLYHLSACRKAGLIVWAKRAGSQSVAYTFLEAAPKPKANQAPKAHPAPKTPKAPKAHPAPPQPPAADNTPDPSLFDYLVELTVGRVAPILANVGQVCDADDRAAIGEMLQSGETSRSITRTVFYAASSPYWQSRSRPSQVRRFPAIFEQARRSKSAAGLEIEQDWGAPVPADWFFRDDVEWDGEGPGWPGGGSVGCAVGGEGSPDWV